MFAAIISKEKSAKIKLEKYMCNHQLASYFIAFIGMPILTLLAVSVCVTATMLPISWLLGWL